MKLRLTCIQAVLIAGLAGATSSVLAAPQYLTSGKTRAPNLPLSDAVLVGNQLFLSGQIGNMPGSTKLIEGGVVSETRQVLDNIKSVLESNGYSMADVVKCTAMLVDMRDRTAFNEIYQSYFPKGKYPARSTFGVTGLAFDAKVEVECMASR